VIVRKAYGGAYIAMGSKALGADIVYAWPTAEIAVLGPEAAVRIIYKRELAKKKGVEVEEEVKKLAAEYRKLFANPYYAAEYGLVDDVIEPRKTRYKLYRALQALLPKREQRFEKKHGNIPL